MTGNFNTQERLSCDVIMSLFERIIVGECLCDEEQWQINDHLERCQRCHNAYRLTNALPLFVNAAMEEDFDGEISSVLNRVRDEKKMASRWNVRFAAYVGVASLAAAMIFGIWILRGSDVPIKDPITSFQCTPSAPVEVVSGVFMTHCLGNEPGATIEEGAVRVSLKLGAVALSVHPHRFDKKQVSVETPQGEVVVKGTLFAVHVDSFANSHVEVFRGVVEVIPKKEAHNSFKVTAGYGTKLTVRSIVELKSPITQPLVDMLNSQSEEELADDETVAEQREHNGTGPTKSGNGVIVSEETAEENSHGTRAKEKFKTRTGEPLRRINLSMDKLIEDARTCLIEQDWNCAASKYKRVLNVYSRHPESTAVLISLAKIELRHLNTPKQALNHYNMYLKKAPNGPLVEEASFGTAKSYRRLGLEDQEKKALLRFVEKYPQSAMLGKVQKRLRQIEGAPTN